MPEVFYTSDELRGDILELITELTEEIDDMPSKGYLLTALGSHVHGEFTRRNIHIRREQIDKAVAEWFASIQPED